MGAPFKKKPARILRDLASSELIAPADLKRQLAEFNADRVVKRQRPTTLDDLGDWLIVRGLLTPWQFANIRAGRWRGFFFDGHKLLAHLKVDDDYSYYLAEQLATRRQVTLRVSPPGRAKVPGTVEYSVVDEPR